MTTAIYLYGSKVNLWADGVPYASYLVDEVAEAWVNSGETQTLQGSAGGTAPTNTPTYRWTAHVRLTNGRVYSLYTADTTRGGTPFANTSAGAQSLLATMIIAS